MKKSVSLAGATLYGEFEWLESEGYENFYDAQNGFVPAGFGNSPTNPAAPYDISVLDTWTECAFDSGRRHCISLSCASSWHCQTHQTAAGVEGRTARKEALCPQSPLNPHAP